jgi:hypothetical protein
MSVNSLAKCSAHYLLQVVGHLTTRFQARHILTFGWLTLAVGMYNTGDENVEQLWYVFWLFKAIVSLSLLWAVALLCKWVLRRIRANRAKRRPVEQSIVHSLSTLKPRRNFSASDSETVDLCPSETKRRDG